MDALILEVSGSLDAAPLDGTILEGQETPLSDGEQALLVSGDKYRRRWLE